MQLTQRLLPSSLVRSLAMMFFGVLLCAVASPMFAAEAAGTDRSWGAFFGRTHVLFLHLPIGLLVGAFVIEFFGLFKRSKGFDVAAAWLFVLGICNNEVFG